MAIIADSGGIYGLYDRGDSAHAALRAAIEQEPDEIVISCVSLGEIDYLLRARLGNRALLQFVADVESGAFRIEPVTPQDLSYCARSLRKYADLDLGLCDAAVVATADRLGTNRILTVDERDFRVMRTLRGKPFRLLPTDLKRKR
jgi:predicted nucleic acid-binding protein